MVTEAVARSVHILCTVDTGTTNNKQHSLNNGLHCLETSVSIPSIDELINALLAEAVSTRCHGSVLQQLEAYGAVEVLNNATHLQ